MRHTAKRSRLHVTQGVARDATGPGRLCTLGEVPGVVRRVEGEDHPFEKQARRIQLMARAVPRPDTRRAYEMN
jgi:hypothetical protein